MEDSKENKEAEEIAKYLIEQANRGGEVKIYDLLKSATALIAALDILVRALQDGTCRAVEKLNLFDVDDEIFAPSLRNLFQNCPNLREVRGLAAGDVAHRALLEAINEGMCPNIQTRNLPDVNKEAEELARKWIVEANQGEWVTIHRYGASSTVIAAALEILVRAHQDGSCRAVEKLSIGIVQDKILAPSLRNLFQNCPNLSQVHVLSANLGYRAFMEAINEGMCPNVKNLKLPGYEMNDSDVALLARVIENGKLKSVETLVYGFHESSYAYVNAIVSALSTGKCSNLRELEVDGECDASVAEKFVGAIADQRFPRLRAVSGRLFDPKELSNRSKWEAAKALLVKNLSNYWIEASRRGKEGILIDGKANHPFVFVSALELFGRACQDGTCRSLENLEVTNLKDESKGTSLWNIFQNCPNLQKVELMNANVACRIFLEAVSKGMCPELEDLNFCDDDGIDYLDATALARAIENGNLKNLRKLMVGDWHADVAQSFPDAVVPALTNGECPNLESVTIYGKCDASNAEKFVHAIADEKFPKLKKVDERLMELRNYLTVLKVPDEFADKDNETILSFLREGWKHGTEPLSVVKVVITGPGSVGKTCLVSRLVKDSFPEDSRMTNGVDVTRKHEDGGLELVYYDFGGQPVYATTHQLFLRTRAVFLVAWDSRMETTDFMHQSFHQYVRDLLDASPEAQIVFVTTKADEGCSPLTGEEQAQLREMYKRNFKDYHHVSAKQRDGIESLKSAIVLVANCVLQAIGGAHGFAGMLVPKPYVELKSLIASLRDRVDKFYLSVDDWNDLAKSVNIIEEERVESVLRLFHEMGEVLRLSTGQIIVDPPRLTDVLGRVVTKDDRYKHNARGGYLRHDELGSIWTGKEYTNELRKGLLRLLQECEIGYHIRDDDGRDYGATLIPAMLYNESETMQTHVEKLRTDHHELKAGPQIVVELSTRSSRFGPKFLAKLRGVSVIGGWWRNGCIAVDMVDIGRSKSIRSFGTVSWNVDEGTVITILAYGQVRLLRRRVLEALGSCLKDFPGAELIGLSLKCSVGTNCHGGWSKDIIQEARLALLHCPGCGSTMEADDIADWIMSQTKSCNKADDLTVHINANETDRAEESHQQSSKMARSQPSDDDTFASLEFLQRRLMNNSGASADELSYLLLVHQKDLLYLGCDEQGREKLNAIWLIFELNGRRCAFPLCPHLIPDSILVNNNLEIPGAFEISPTEWKPLQRDLNKVMTAMLENSLLDILEPCAGAEFKGILWNSVHHAKQSTKINFKQVTVPEIGSIWVHKDDVAYFTDQRQTKLSEDLTNKVTESIKSFREERRAEREKRECEQAEQGENKLPRVVHPDLPACIDDPRELKDSGQAKVYRGTMVGKNGSPEEVAIKVFKKESDWDDCKNEVMLLLDSGHDNVMRVLAAFFEKPLAPKPCFVTRFIPGGSLRDHLDKHGRFVGNEAIQLLKGIGEGLRHLHSLGIVHRDLKSPNILLEGNSLRPVLIDLGLGKRIEDSKRSHATTVEERGTAAWMAPEMMEHSIWNEKTDMYSLGVIMWEILTGKMPYADSIWFQIYRNVMDGGRPNTAELMKKAGLSQAHVNLIESLWHQEPSERPTAKEFLDELRDGTSAHLKHDTECPSET